MSMLQVDDHTLTKAVSGLVAATEALSRESQHSSVKSIGPRRGLNRVEAANYVGISATTFDGMVKAKSMPASVKIGTRNVWDVRALDAAFDALAAPTEANPWDAWG